MTRTLGLATTALAGILALSACGNGAQAQPAAEPSRVQVLSSTSVYADLAAEVGGDLVDSTAIIDSPSQDPHSYEATARDKLAVSKAQLVIGNGGGYDPFIENLAGETARPGQSVLHAVDHSPIPAETAEHEDGHDHDHGHDDEPAAHEGHEGHDHADEEHAGHEHAGYNEHVWYDLESMQQLVPEIAGNLTAIKPEGRAVFEANAGRLLGELAGLESSAKALRDEARGKHFAMTEPVPYHLLVDLGMQDSTPEGFSEAIEGGSEVSPQALKKMGDLLEAGSIDMLAYNTQTASPQTERIRDAAVRQHVPVVDFSETLPQDTRYVDWMAGNLRAIEAGLN
ncbi:metal ABC transporter solute-binding protein, Zn/Mn family [Paeniglutamicibacter sp. R2-26]|uniref:metal ABC transporter solute-binding protein, Zn/Mn family n=1 Tax=Paeniglutamicibacter sp. R2-26 TaxID=3144417 RepID=UPI003EE512AC